MRKALLLPLLVLAGVAAPDMALGYGCAGKASDVEVTLAVPRGRSWAPGWGTGHLSVILVNRSDKALNLFDEQYSWGYYNTTLEWVDAAGHRGVVRPRPVSFDKDIPAVTLLQPGEAKVVDIAASDNSWDGWDSTRNGMPVSVKAIYESRPDTGPEARSPLHVAMWCGKIESKPVDIALR